MRNSYKILVGKERRDHSENLDVDGKTISEWILEEQNGSFSHSPIEKITVSQSAKKFPMEPYTELHESSPHLHNLFKFYLNIILPLTSKSPKWSLPF
jgi:hypothetical protein